MCGCNSGGSCGCSVNAIMLPSAPGLQGLQGVPGAVGGIGPQGPQGPQGPNSNALIVISCVQGGNPMFITTSSSYVPICSFIFPGTSFFGTPSSIKIAIGGFNNNADTNCTIRIRSSVSFIDLNPKDIVTKSLTLNNNSNLIQDLGTITNLSTGEVVYTVEVKSDNGGTVAVSSVMVKK